MPRVDIWIRKTDMPQWQAIDNKPEWIHNHLNSNNSITTNKTILKQELGKLPAKINRVKQDSVTYKQTNNWGA